MVDFVKKEQEKLLNTTLKLTTEKDKIFQQLHNLKALLFKRIQLVKEEFKTQEKEKNEFDKKKVQNFYPKKLNKLKKILK